MRNKQTLIGLGILVIGLLVAILVFTSINNTPSGGDGQTQQDNVSAGVPEVTPDAVGGEAPDQPQPSP
jgi:hypothetical protein